MAHDKLKKMAKKVSKRGDLVPVKSADDVKRLHRGRKDF